METPPAFARGTLNGLPRTPMRLRLQLSFLLSLCFIASGAQWEVVQVIAWGHMIVGHARAMPLAQAITQTFDGEMCPLCRLVATAKRQERSRSDAPPQKTASKALLFFQPISPVHVEPSRAASWRPGEASLVTVERARPPLPPPRPAVA